MTEWCDFLNNMKMDTSTIRPADLAVQAFGGVRALARLIDRDPSAISRWKLDGRIPSNLQRQVLELAWERGIDLTAHDLIFGRHE